MPHGDQATGNLISASLWNDQFDDIQTALTQSIASTGVTPITGNLLGNAGSAAAPGWSFSGDSDTGMYSAGTDQIGFATNATNALTLDASQKAIFAGVINATGAVLTTTSLAGATTFGTSPVLTFGNSTTWTFNGSSGTNLISSLALENDVGVFLDGGGSVITNSTPNSIIWVTVPAAMTVNFWTLVADQSGTINVDILDLNNSSTSIVGAGTKPGLSSAANSYNNAPSSWTTTGLLKGHTYGFVTSSAATLTKLMITLRCTRTAA